MKKRIALTVLVAALAAGAGAVAHRLLYCAPSSPLTWGGTTPLTWK